LEVDDDAEDEDGSQQVGQVRQVLSVEGLLERAHLVVTGGQQMEQGDDRSLELSAAAGIDGGRREGLCNN